MLRHPRKIPAAQANRLLLKKNSYYLFHGISVKSYFFKIFLPSNGFRDSRCETSELFKSFFEYSRKWLPGIKIQMSARSKSPEPSHFNLRHLIYFLNFFYFFRCQFHLLTLFDQFLTASLLLATQTHLV